jgi:hypothetical protein
MSIFKHFTKGILLQDNQRPLINLFIVVSFIAALFFLLFILIMKEKINLDSGSIITDMSVSAAGQANLWINNQHQIPISVNIMPNQRSQYYFHGINEEIDYLRFDLVPGVENARIKIFKITIKSPVGHDFIIFPADLGKWKIFNGKITNLNNEYIELFSGKNISLVSNLPYKVHLIFSPPIHKIFKLMSKLKYIYLLLYVSLFISVLYCFKNQFNSFLWVLMLIPFVFIVLSQLIAASNIGQIHVDKAIGLAAYSGKSLIPNSLFLYSMTFFVIIIAFLFASINKKKFKVIKKDQVSITFSFSDFLPYILIFIYLFPDLSNDYPRHSITWNGMLVPNWDSDNSVTWAYMIKKGLIPFKDFWYPYGFSYIFDFPFPLGKFLFASVSFIFFSFFIFYLKAITRISSFSIIFITLLLLIGNIPANNQLIYPQPERHLLPFVLIFSYIYSRDKNNLKPLIIFWLLSCLAFMIEPSQVIYAALGIGIIFCIDLINIQKINFKKVFRKFLREFFVFICFIAAIISILKFKGLFQNISDFYLEMDTVANYLAVPTNLTFNLKSLITLDFFLVFTPFFLLGIGLYKAINNPNFNNNLPLVLLACAAIGVMQIQKHSIRPIDWALFYSASLGIFIFLLLLYNEYRLKISTYMKCNISLLFFLYFYMNDSLLNFADHILKFDEKIQYTIQSFRELNQKSYRALNKFPPNLGAYHDEKILIETLRNKYKNPTFYTLPDNPILYLIADNKPPYHINGFNLSPIFEQYKIINNLKKNQVQFIIIEPNKNYIDGFSYTVRLPLVYKYVAENYIFDFETSRFMVFRLKKSSEGSNLNEWVKALSKSMDFGFLLSHAKNPDQDDINCISNCEDYLKVSLPKNHKERVNLTFLSLDGEFNISFITQPEKNVYWLKLNNLWFYRNNSKYLIISDDKLCKNEFLKFKSNSSLY